MHALTVIVESVAIAAMLLIDNPEEPDVVAVPPDGFDRRKGQQWPTIC